MTIRAEKKLVEINVNHYVADDGTEFNSQDACLAYEAQCRAMRKQEEERELKEAFWSLVIGHFEPDSLGMYDTGIYVCKLNNEADYDIVDKWCDMNGFDMEYFDKPKSFPCRYVFSLDQSGYVCTEPEGFMDWARDLTKLLDATENIGKD